MNNQFKEQLKNQIDAIQKKMMIASFLSMPGVVLLSLGMVGKVDMSELRSLHPMLANEKLVSFMLIIGLFSTLLYLIRFYSLLREQKRLKKRMAE